MKIIQRAAFVILAILCIAMATATFVENSYGPAVAHEYIYESWWFIGLWCIAIVCMLPCIPGHIRGLVRLLKRCCRRTTVIGLLLMVSSLGASGARVVERVQADSMRSAQVVYNNRICPLNTAARDFTLKITGRTSWHGLSPEQVILSWALYPEDWKDVAMIRVKKAAARQTLGIKGNYARFADFFDSQGNYRLKADQFPDLDERLTLIVLATRGEFFTPLPQGMTPIPSQRIEAELLYNSLPLDTLLFASCFTLAFLLFFIGNLKVLRPLRSSKAVAVAIHIATILLTLLLAACLALRWYISGHLPLSNTYETLLVVALTALIIANLSRRYRMEALIVGGATLLVAHIGALDPQITTLMPVLQSPWLSSHVTTIMISYCLFAMLLFRPNRTMLIWAEVLLATGIILGSIWAKTAWGTYWSWDPKETWALISLITYAYPLHPHLLPWFRHEGHMRLYLRLAFLTILMTYFGCNYLLTGMHSYAN